MREIKFRAWDKERIRMIYFDSVGVSWFYEDDYRLDAYEAEGTVVGRGGIVHDDFADKEPSVEIMQYTGIKDKNGKEIYEGDRLKHTESFDEVYFYQVKWNEENATFDFEDVHTGEIFHGIDMIFARTEVIGNIHEHPHLLKEAE